MPIYHDGAVTRLGSCLSQLSEVLVQAIAISNDGEGRRDMPSKLWKAEQSRISEEHEEPKAAHYLRDRGTIRRYGRLFDLRDYRKVKVFGKIFASAFPHGTARKRKLHEGDRPR